MTAAPLIPSGFQGKAPPRAEMDEPFPLPPDVPAEFVVPQGMTDDQARALAPHLKSQSVTSKTSILQEADAIAGQDRSRDYGHPYENHRRIADIWSVLLEKKLTAPIEPREVALLMIGLKLAREVNTPKRDNMVDAAGYIKCVDMIDQAQREGD